LITVVRTGGSVHDHRESRLEVSRRLGYSSVLITGDIYGHITAVTSRASAERLAQAVHQH
jgi:hypothetical protein